MQRHLRFAPATTKTHLHAPDTVHDFNCFSTNQEPKEPTERAEIEPSYDVPNTRAASVSHLSHTQKNQRVCMGET